MFEYSRQIEAKQLVQQLQCRTRKLLSQKRRHLAAFCISFYWQRWTCPEKEEITISKNDPLAVFCINHTANECYDFVRIKPDFNCSLKTAVWLVANRGNGRCNRYPSFLATRSLETTHFVTWLSYWVYTNMIHTVVVRDRTNQGRTKLRNCRVTLYAMCHSSSQQRLVRRVFVLKLKFEIRQEPIKINKILHKFLPLFYATF